MVLISWFLLADGWEEMNSTGNGKWVDIKRLQSQLDYHRVSIHHSTPQPASKSQEYINIYYHLSPPPTHNLGKVK